MFMPVIEIVIRAVLATASEGAKSGGSVWIELLKVAVGALGPILAAVIAGTAGAFITHRYASRREEAERAAADERHKKDLEALQKRHDLDKESEWRSHAVELTKLEVNRKLEIWKATAADKRNPLRPAVLDFLANYRDLVELDNSTPRDLYLKILADRISHLSEEDLKTLSPAEAETVVSKQTAQETAVTTVADEAGASAQPARISEPEQTGNGGDGSQGADDRDNGRGTN